MAGAFSALSFDEYAFDVDYSSSPAVYLSIAGIERAHGRIDEEAKILFDSLTIVDALNETPNTCTFKTMGFGPLVGQRVLISLGGVTNPDRLFAGTVLTSEQSYIGTPALQVYDVSCADDIWKLGHVLVTKRYTAETATDIAIDLIDTYAPDFDTADIEAGLDLIDEITFTNEPLAKCLTRLAARIGGYWYVGEFEDVHFFITDTATDPAPLTLSAPPRSTEGHALTIDRDLSQMITRVLGVGGGAVVLSDIAVGETILPVASTDYFNALGGTFISGPQRCTYTGIAAAGQPGSLVGTGAMPLTAPTVNQAAGAGVTTGAHGVTVVFKTASGRTLPSPVATVTVGNVPAPTTTPSAGAPLQGGSVTAGAHYYAYTEVTPAGETTPSPISNTVTAIAETGAPSSGPTLTDATRPGAGLDYNVLYQYAYTFWDGGACETTLSTAGLETTNTFATDIAIGVQISTLVTPPAGFQRRFYRTEGGGSVFKLLPYGQAQGQFSEISAGYYIDVKADAELGITAPTVNTTKKAIIPLSGIGLPSAPWVTDRKVYGTAAGGAQLKLVAAIGLTGTTYNVTIADGSLGANVPSSAPTANQIAITAAAIGPSGTTDREFYMSAAGGGARKLALTIADNTTTTGTITMSDATLAGQAAEPGTDTSGLSQPAGQVLPTAVEVPVAGSGVLPSAGWAIVGNGEQVLRYTANTGSKLTGVPATGIGSITGAIDFNSSITAAPMLTGIPASSTGSILYPITKGDDANLFIIEDDLEAQGILIAALGSGDGIVEEFIQDRRMTETEMRARARAVLAQRGQIDASISYAIGGTRDPGCRDHRSGRTIDVTLDDLNIDESFKIQSVRITGFLPALEPVFNVEASTNRFSFEDLLRLARRNDAP